MSQRVKTQNAWTKFNICQRYEWLFKAMSLFQGPRLSVLLEGVIGSL